MNDILPELAVRIVTFGEGEWQQSTATAGVVDWCNCGRSCQELRMPHNEGGADMFNVDLQQS